jgi:hypothetical protein
VVGYLSDNDGLFLKDGDLALPPKVSRPYTDCFGYQVVILSTVILSMEEIRRILAIYVSSKIFDIKLDRLTTMALYLSRVQYTSPRHPVVVFPGIR